MRRRELVVACTTNLHTLPFVKPKLPAKQLAAWRAYYTTFWRMFAAIEADLQGAGLPSLSWYDVLYELYQAPDRHLRMCDLAQSALLSRSGLTRLVDKLEKEKLIERRSCPDDGRVLHAKLTDKGVETLRKIWPVYRAGIEKYFSDHLSDADAGDLGRILALLPSAHAAELAGERSP